MRDKAEWILAAALAAFGLCGAVAVALSWQLATRSPGSGFVPGVGGSGSNAEAWFARTRPYCNGVEVATRLRWDPPPRTSEGSMHAAACWALAGGIAEARALIEGLPENEQWRAAGVVFEAGHPTADAGDDAAAGPLMELVVEFWPNHYMALYHAGAARFGQGDYGAAAAYLEDFLEHYQAEDGWRTNAESMLGAIQAR